MAEYEDRKARNPHGRPIEEAGYNFTRMQEAYPDKLTGATKGRIHSLKMRVRVLLANGATYDPKKRALVLHGAHAFIMGYAPNTETSRAKKLWESVNALRKEGINVVIPEINPNNWYICRGQALRRGQKPVPPKKRAIIRRK